MAREVRGDPGARFRRAVRRSLTGTEQLVGGLGTALMALLLLVVVVGTAVASLVGVGLLAVPVVARGIRALADRERHRLARYGVDLPSLGPPPRGIRGAPADPSLRRELGWLLGHGTLGWTMACGSGRALADLMSGRKPEVAFEFT